jgi:hypothetical protein
MSQRPCSRRTRIGFGPGSALDTWFAAHADGITCLTGRSTSRATSRVRSLTPELSKGLEFDLLTLIDPEAFGNGIEGAVNRKAAITRADPATRHPHKLLTSAETTSSLGKRGTPSPPTRTQHRRGSSSDPVDVAR